MRRWWLLAAPALALAGCGSSHQPPVTTVVAPPVTATAPARGGLVVRLTAPTHAPRVNVPWRYTVRVTAKGKPVPAHIHIQVLFMGAAVGQIGRHAVRSGVWAETIKWPPASRGHPLVFQASAVADGRSGVGTYPLRVK